MNRVSKCLLFFFISFIGSCSASDWEIREITVDGIPMEVEIADTPEKRAIGLMDRKSLSADKGMLFIFQQEKKLSFWMKNTSIPLSIAYIAKSGEIVEIYHMEPFSERSVQSRRSVLYALEVNQGYFEKQGIQPGDLVQISP